MLTERMHHYVFPVSTLTTAIQEGLSLSTDDDAPFRLSGISIWTTHVKGGAFDGQLELRFARPDGRLTQRIFTPADAMASGNMYQIAGSPGANPNVLLRSPVSPNIIYPPRSVIAIDLKLLSNVGTSPAAIVVFSGTKIFNSTDVWAPRYPASFRARPYLDNLTIPGVTTARFPLLNNIFTAQQDSDFVWQVGAYNDFAHGAGCGAPALAVCQLTDLGVIVRDWRQKAYSNDYVPAALLFPFLNAQQPGFLYPEIYVPTKQQLSFDLNYLWTGFTPATEPLSVVLGLKGMKVYPQ